MDVDQKGEMLKGEKIKELRLLQVELENLADFLILDEDGHRENLANIERKRKDILEMGLAEEVDEEPAQETADDKERKKVKNNIYDLRGGYY